MRRPEFLVLRLELAVRRAQLIVRGLEPQVLLGDSFELAAEPVELLAVDVAAVVGRGVCCRRAGGRDGGRVRDEEGLVALLAADFPADVRPPDAERGIDSSGRPR